MIMKQGKVRAVCGENSKHGSREGGTGDPVTDDRPLLNLKIGRSGWMSTSQIFLTHYGSHVSRSHATPTQETDYVGVSEAAGL